MGLNVLSCRPLMQTQSFLEAETVSLQHAASAPFCFQLSPWILVLQSPGHFLEHLFPVFNFPGLGFYQRILIDTPLSHRAVSQPCLTITSLACPQNFKTGLLFTEVRHLCHEWPWSVVPMFKTHFNLSFFFCDSEFCCLRFQESIALLRRLSFASDKVVKSFSSVLFVFSIFSGCVAYKISKWRLN